jgi:hypothetical protein
VLKSSSKAKAVKRKALSRVRLPDGTVREAEIHWYEAAGLGRKELKIKHYVDFQQ